VQVPTRRSKKESLSKKDPARLTGAKGDLSVGNVHAGAGAVVQIVGPGGRAENTVHRARRPPHEIESIYTRHIRATCDQVWQPGTASQRRQLLQVYAAMRAVPIEFAARPFNGQARIKAGPVFDMALAADRLVLLGPPGGGKSTFLRYLALSLVNRAGRVAAGDDANTSRLGAASGFPTELEGYVPVWIELRKLKWPAGAHPLGWPRIFAAHWESLKQAGPWSTEEWEDVRGFLEQKLQEGRLLFLLDGLDEVTRIVADGESSGSTPILDLFGLQQAIVELAEWRPPGYPPDRSRGTFHRILVTCRQTSWNDGWRIEPWVDACGGFVASLEMLGEAQRLSFLTTSFGNEGVARQIHDHLMHPDRNWGGRLAELISVPLNLTMIAWLAERLRHDAATAGRHAKNEAPALPATRAAIYEQVVHAILWEIDDGKTELGQGGEKTLPALVGRKPERRQQFVQWLAEVAHESLRETRLDHTWLVNSYARALHGPRSMHFQGEAVEVLRTIQCRAGILRHENPGTSLSPAAGLYQFVHRSFCEYLAGLYLIQGPVQTDGRRFSERAAAWLDGGPRGGLGTARDSREVRELVWEPLRLAAGYFGVPAEDRKPLLSAHALRSVEAVELLIHDLVRRNPRRGHDVWLAGELALEAGFRTEPRLMNLHDALVQTMQSNGLSEPERAEVGRILGILGDWRPGVAPLAGPSGGNHFFSWSNRILKGTKFTLGGDPFAFNGNGVGVSSAPKEVQLDFCIAHYPITNAQYDHFETSQFFRQRTASMGWQRRERSDQRFNVPNHPVVHIDLKRAESFCEWINSLALTPADLGITEAEQGERWEVRLPSEAEWEYAARGPEGRWLPWLARPDFGLAAPEPNHRDGKDRCNRAGSGINSTSAVGMYPGGKSWCGALDLLGNIMEWTSSVWVTDQLLRQGSIEAANNTELRVLRGGSWAYGGPDFLRNAARRAYSPRCSDAVVGFRVVCVCVAGVGG
jgi:formylglycine-generating enzyme required for sulfatase activity